MDGSIVRTISEHQIQPQESVSSGTDLLNKAPSGSTHRTHPILHMQHALGNQAVQHLLQSEAASRQVGLPDNAPPNVWYKIARLPSNVNEAKPLQTKLQVSEPGDAYEREADRIADQVMAMPSTGAVNSGPLHIQRFSGQSARQAGEAPASVDQVLASPGQPLEPGLRQDMEQRFGYDFSRVRVHSNEVAAQAVREVGAIAYATGDNIVFGSGRCMPGTAEGKRLLAHELTHVVQQRGDTVERVQRAPGGTPTVPAKALESLEAVAQRIARLAVGPSSAVVNLEGGPDKVVSVVRNIRTGQLYVGLNTGTPANLTKPIETAIEAQKQRIAAGEVKVVHTAANAVGGHAEVNALNRAIQDEQAVLHRAITAEEIAAKFEMHNVWLSGKKQFTTAARCEHCKGITRGVQVTESLFKAEGGVSGEISVRVGGKAVTTGGRIVEAETIHGEIPGPRPEVKPTGTFSQVKGPSGPSVGASVAKAVITEIALNVLLVAVTYYLNKWHAEKQGRKFNHDLEGLLPEVNTRLKNKEAEIVEKAKAFPLVYGNITIVYTRDRTQPKDFYNEGSMRIQNVAISHQNYQTPERLVEAPSVFEDKDPLYSLTCSVPLFEEETAEKGASSGIYNYRAVREGLSDTSRRVRLSAVLALHKLAEQDVSLKTLVIRDLLGRLQDEDAGVRLLAAAALSRLKAKIAIQYIREAISTTSDDKKEKFLQGHLRELEQL